MLSESAPGWSDRRSLSGVFRFAWSTSSPRKAIRIEPSAAVVLLRRPGAAVCSSILAVLGGLHVVDSYLLDSFGRLLDSPSKTWIYDMYVYNIICIIVYVCVYVVYVSTYIYIWLVNSMQDFQETNPWAIWANSIRRSTARLRLTRMPQQAGHSEELAVYGATVEVRIRTGCPWHWLAYSSGEIQIGSALHLVISSAI
jgi:hypothetical protein